MQGNPLPLPTHLLQSHTWSTPQSCQVPNCGEPCFPGLAPDLTHDFPKKGLVTSQRSGSQTLSRDCPAHLLLGPPPSRAVLPCPCLAVVRLRSVFKTRWFIVGVGYMRVVELQITAVNTKSGY